MVAGTIGIYHDPPLWLGNPPIEKPTKQREVDFSAFAEIIFRKDLSSGIRVNATRDGMFGFSFENWPPDCNATEKRVPEDLTFDELAEITLNRASVINSFLAFFYAALETNPGLSLSRMLTTPELMVPMSGDFDEPPTGMSFGNDKVAWLASSRYPLTYPTAYPPAADKRILSRTIIDPPGIALDDAASRLEALLSDHQADGPLMLDLFVRSSKSYQDHNYSASLITNWSIIEKLTFELWNRYLDKNRNRGGTPFINRKRLDKLNDTRTFTASVVTEILSLAKYIDKGLYEDMSSVRQVRNNWIHSLKAVSREDAMLSNDVCEQMFSIVRSIRVSGAKAVSIHG